MTQFCNAKWLISTVVVMVLIVLPELAVANTVADGYSTVQMFNCTVSVPSWVNQTISPIFLGTLANVTIACVSPSGLQGMKDEIRIFTDYHTAIVYIVSAWVLLILAIITFFSVCGCLCSNNCRDGRVQGARR